MTLRIDPALSSVKLASLQKGLVLHMPLDQQSYNPATKRFTDKTPYSNHGTSCNTATFTADRMGQPNRAMSFNGTDDFIDCGNDESLSPTDAITIEAWVKPNDITTDQIILFKGNSDWQGYSIRLRNNILNFNINSEGAYAATKTLPSANAWYHIVGTYNKNLSSNQIKIYVNSVEGTPDTYNGDINSGSINLILGRKGIEPSRYFNGTIDEVRIYNRALSADEIIALHEMYRPKFLI